MVAFGVDKQGSWPVAATVAGALILACLIVPGRGQAARAAPG
jgi:hypothetical protein